jgi:DHA3 family tetracycline resistance protein-like MFS transporter
VKINVNQAYLQGSQVGQIAYLAGIPISRALGPIALNIPIFLSGILFLLLGVFLFVVMREEGFQHISLEERESWGMIIKKFKDSIGLLRGCSISRAVIFLD